MVRFTRIPSWSFPNYSHRLPDHYYHHRMNLKKPSTRVHDSPPETDLLDLKYEDKIKRVVSVPDMPIEVQYPKEADLGLWGGEGIVKGYIKPRKYFQAGWPRPKYWFPNLKKVVLYSEILDKHFSIICTARTLSLIDQHCGLDSYILRTEVQDFKSQLALSLRREMLLTLVRKQFKDANHERDMLEKYSDVIIPAEEAEWFGLAEHQAITKHMLETARNNEQLPLKYEFTRKLIDELQNMKDDADPESPTTSSSSGWMSKVKSKLGM